MHVFPGGELEEGDCDPEWERLCRKPLPGEVEKICADGTTRAKALGLMVAGIRELFEEAGILLALRDSGGSACRSGEEQALYREWRAKLHGGEAGFREMVRNLGLRPSLDRLVYFAHWITPEISPIRYDTRFFLAPMPPGQDPDHDRSETTASLWIEPAEALRQGAEGKLFLLPPTMANLYALADFSSLRQALRAAREREVPTILPRFDT